MKSIYKFTAKVIFPEGVTPGMGSIGNQRMVARNGKGEILLRGSALAGVLRHTHAESIKKYSLDPAVSRWFGTALEGEIGQESTVQVADVVIDNQVVRERTHILINRHTGAVVEKGLFSIEAVPPGSRAKISITVDPNTRRPMCQEVKPETSNNEAVDTVHSDDTKEFITHLARYLTDGLLVGGCSNRGIGRMVVDGKLYLQTFNMETLEGIAAFLDAQYNERQTGISLHGEAQQPAPSPDRLEITLELGIPRGEDVLVGEGQEAEYVLRPQSVMLADGTQHWRIPGSSLRGIFRGWMTRLATREILSLEEANQDGQSSSISQKILDSVERWDGGDGNSDAYNPDNMAWGFVTPEERQDFQEEPQKLNDPILDLFGSLYKKGRIHMGDAFSQEAVSDQATDRMHVAVDRISGGAHEGALFKNQVLTGSDVRFSLRISVNSPKANEVAWLIKTLRALHLGILLVGSSKGSGRLEIKSISAQGPMAGHFNSFAQEVI